MNRQSLSCLIATAAAIVLALLGRGEVLVSNLDERWTDQGFGDFQAIYAEGSSGLYVGGIFSTGPERSAVTAATAEILIDPPVSPSVRLQIFRGKPFQTLVNPPIVGTLANHSVDPTPAQFPGINERVRFTSLDPIVLDANESYWLGAVLPLGPGQRTGD